jgi:hypothetical protein
MRAVRRKDVRGPDVNRFLLWVGINCWDLRNRRCCDDYASCLWGHNAHNVRLCVLGFAVVNMCNHALIIGLSYQFFNSKNRKFESWWVRLFD